MTQITKSEIVSELMRIAEIIGAKPDQLPTVDNNHDFARPNISFSSEGTVYYEAYEKGKQLFSIPAIDIDHLMFMVFKDVTFTLACDYELENRIPNEDFRRQLFSKKVELMQTINPTWVEPIQKEIAATLRSVPFNDTFST